MPSTLNARKRAGCGVLAAAVASCARAAVPRRSGATRPQRPAHHHRHAARGRGRRLRQSHASRRRGSIGSRPAASASPGARVDRRHAAVARQHPLGPLSVPSRRARKRRLPLSAGGRHARDAAHGRGYRTGAFVSAFPLDARFGLTRGFDVYDDRFPQGEANDRVSRAGAAWRRHRRRRARVDRTQRERRRRHRRPPRRGSPGCISTSRTFPMRRRSRTRRDIATRRTSARCRRPMRRSRRCLQPILDAPRRRDTLVVLTGDHGESLGEHGEMTHGLFAYEATLRVPLILYQPHLLHAARGRASRCGTSTSCRRSSTRSARPCRPALDGRSLLPLAAGAAAPPTATYFESLSASLNRGWAPLYGVVARIAEVHRSADSRAVRPGGRSGRGARTSRRRGRPRSASCSGCSPRCAPTTAAWRRRARAPRRASSCAASATSPARRRRRMHYTEADDPKRLIDDRSADRRGRLALSAGRSARRDRARRDAGRSAGPTCRCRWCIWRSSTTRPAIIRRAADGDPPRARAESGRRTMWRRWLARI